MKAAEKPKQRVLIRVPKSQAISAAVEKEDGVDVCLECWKYWLKVGDDRDLGAKGSRLLQGDNDAYGVSPYDAQRRRDLEIGEATDKMIEGLIRIHQWAIHEMCSMAYVWKFPNADLLIVGPQAREALAEKLRRNIATSSLF